MTNHQQARYRPAFPRLIAQRFVARVRPDRVQSLARLADVHPGAPAGGRWIGVRTVLIDSIRGTASTSAAASRARDFRPFGERAPADWQYRWSRLMAATWEQAILPPIQVLKTGDDYWVVDGHNRVALARERGQLWIDADVTELDLRSGNAASSAKEN